MTHDLLEDVQLRPPVTLAVRPVLPALIRSGMMRHKTEACTRSG
jgi:hypothetical protein